MSDKKMKLIWWVIILILGISIAAMGLAMAMRWSIFGRFGLLARGMMGYGLRSGFMILTPIAIMALIVLGAYFALTELSNPSERQEEGALEILKERYAKGEITREEYLKMKEELQ